MSKFRKFTIWASGTVAFAGVTAAVKQSFFTDRHAKVMNSILVICTTLSGCRNLNYTICPTLNLMLILFGIYF